jgi:hypothetical protein
MLRPVSCLVPRTRFLVAVFDAFFLGAIEAVNVTSSGGCGDDWRVPKRRYRRIGLIVKANNYYIVRFRASFSEGNIGNQGTIVQTQFKWVGSCAGNGSAVCGTTL